MAHGWDYSFRYLYVYILYYIIVYYIILYYIILYYIILYYIILYYIILYLYHNICIYIFKYVYIYIYISIFWPGKFPTWKASYIHDMFGGLGSLMTFSPRDLATLIWAKITSD